MVKVLLTKKKSLLLFFFIAFTSFAQENEKDVYYQFDGFKKLGFFVSPVMYSKAKINRKYGDYKLNNNNTPSLHFGFDYVKNPMREYTFRTGLHFDLVPFYNFDFSINENDLPNIDYEYSPGPFKNNSKLNITIPILFEMKKQMAENIFFNVSSGLNVMLMQEGGYEVSYSVGLPETSEDREVFALYADAGKNFFYPNLVISPGFYFTYDSFILQTNFIYQKAIINYFEGEYQFGNLEVSQPTRGDYKMSGDYIGFSFVVFLKKKNQ